MLTGHCGSDGQPKPGQKRPLVAMNNTHFFHRHHPFKWFKLKGHRNRISLFVQGNAMASQSQGSKGVSEAVAQTVLSLLPPDPDVLPEPSAHFPLLPPMSVPTDVVALVSELHGPA